MIQEMAASTNTRIAFDALAREYNHCLSLNNVLEVECAQQNNIWDVLVRNKMYPVFLSRDTKQAFFQVNIQELDRDALRFSWKKS